MFYILSIIAGCSRSFPSFLISSVLEIPSTWSTPLHPADSFPFLSLFSHDLSINYLDSFPPSLVSYSGEHRMTLFLSPTEARRLKFWVF